MPEKIRVHIFVKGLVQGVFFRAFTKQKADFLGLTGWVRNTKDKRVEVLLEGEKEKLKEMIRYLKKGPPLAKVESLEIKREKLKENEFENFQIRYD